MLPKTPDGLAVLTTRPRTSSPAFDRSRQYAAACLVGAKCPLRWTATTASHSSSVMFTSIRSRRIPALFTRMSSRPNSSIACCTSRSAPAKSATFSPFVDASPPMARISSTTCSAGPASEPSPATPAPRSLTTTLAPAAASASACERPMPRPAPVTIAPLPLRSGMTGSLVPVQVARGVDLQPLGDIRLHARERARGDVIGANPSRELTLLGVVLARQLRQLAPHDAERVERDEGAEAQPLVVEPGEDLAREEFLDCLRQLVRGRPPAHVMPCRSSRSQISYSPSAPSRPRIASSTLRSCPVRCRCACVRQPIAQPTFPASSQ